MTSVNDALKIIVGRRWPLIALLFAVEVAVVVVVANSAFFPSELSSYERQYNSIETILNETALGQVGGIFANNFKVATVELTPVLGPLVFGISLYQTARIIEVIGIINGVGVGLALANLFFLPSTWLELPAYAIAATESAYLAYAVYLGVKVGWGRFVDEIRFLMASIMLIAGVLVVAAVFEVSEIQIASSSPEGPAYAFLTWLPFAAMLAGLLVFWKRARRDASERAPNMGGSQAVGYPGLPRRKKDAASSPTPSSRDERGATP
jgi:uncharacterized membrane protein SpoIIM required for sporulation